jgi:hypothetical protein
MDTVSFSFCLGDREMNEKLDSGGVLRQARY